MEIDLKDFEQLYKSSEIVDLLIEKGIIKKKALRKRIAYERNLEELQVAMLHLQQHIVKENKRLLIIFEGRDAAGKGGTISRSITKLNPKKYRVVALSKPTEAEQNQWYFQRYIKELPQKGEIVFFDRSWYNRAVVEPVFGFCTDEQYKSFMGQVNDLERLLVEEGIILVKIFLNISKAEQEERLDDRRNNPLKQWKIGSLDQQAQEKWNDYTQYIDAMLKQTATGKAPWVVIDTDQKKEARLNAMHYIVSNIAGFQPKQLPKLDGDVLSIRD